MKIVSAKQMAHIEAQAYRDGASESDFMEEAGSGVALVVYDYADRYQLDRQVLLLCGKGNNAGDAFVTGIHLIHLDYEVVAIHLAPIEECSQLCKENYRRFLEEGGRLKTFGSVEEIFFPPHGLIVDGIFGTGFHGDVEGHYAAVIEAANRSGVPIISVDIPSGLNGETGEAAQATIRATETAFLGLPKIGFFLKDGWKHVGKLRYVDFGLPRNYIEESDSESVMLTKELLYPQLPRIEPTRHKYQAGYVVGLAGSPGFPGAAILASQAALRGGAGMMRLLYPQGIENQLAFMPPELIKTPFNFNDSAAIIAELNKATATFVGPGLGRSPEVTALLKAVLPKLEKPCVIDADALYFLSENKVQLPRQTILTPHLGELMRLLHLDHAPTIDHVFLKSLQKFVEEWKITLVLKGAPTFILHPDESIAISPAGTPGMATAGSGDVLTGLLAALLAQGLPPRQAACLGVYIHGLAGEHAALELTAYCMNASDILYYFPEGFRLVEV